MSKEISCNGFRVRENKVHKEDMVEKLWLKYTNLGGYNGRKHFVDITLDGDFENASQCYEDWCAVWVVKIYALTRPGWNGQWRMLDKPIVADSRCIHCAIERVLKQAKIEEEKP